MAQDVVANKVLDVDPEVVLADFAQRVDDEPVKVVVQSLAY